MLTRAFLLPALLLSASACAPSFGKGVAPLPSPMLLAAGDRPSLFIRPEPDSAVIGYLADGVPLELAGSIEYGRVPVRVEGPLRARGYVAETLLRLRVQRRGRVRGTPVYVAPGDLVRVLGNEPGAADRLRVEVTPQLGEREPRPYQGSFPTVGLAARAPEAQAEPPDPGLVYQVPANVDVPLYELPGGPLVARLDAHTAPYEVRVISAQEGWLAVRAGTGPYLIGWTDVALLQRDGAAQTATAPTTSAPSMAGTTTAPLAQPGPDRGVPARLVNEPGELRRVAAHSKVVFGEQVIGVFKTEGWARVITTYPSGFADVFAAADDQLAIRGLLRTVDLLPTQQAPQAIPAPLESNPPLPDAPIPAAPAVPVEAPPPESAPATTGLPAPAPAALPED